MRLHSKFSFTHPFTRLLEKAHGRGVAYTSLDAMKLFAIINMTVDHIGFYFFPHDMWLRALGRITFPVWFFLVGYTRARSLSPVLWLYAALLIADRPFAGQPIFALNALVSIILCRLVLNACERFNALPARLPELMAVCVVLTFFTMWYFEYGSIAFLFAIFGRMVYLKEKQHFIPLVVVSYVTFIAWQLISFPFDLWQALYVAIGTGWVVYWLARCPLYVVWPDWTRSWWKSAIAILSRNTLPYYFYHRLIFEVLSAVLLGSGLHYSLRLF